MSERGRHIEFYQKLFALLKEYNVEMIASDDQRPYGQHRPLIGIAFEGPYAEDEWKYIDSSSDLPNRFSPKVSDDL